MTDQIINDTVTILGGAGGFVALALYLRKVFKGMGLEDMQRNTHASAAAAENTVIHTLRAEVERLAVTNTKMSSALSDLQVEIINLRNENITFVGEVGALRNENAMLTSEIMKLQEQISGWSTKCDACPHKTSRITVI